MLVADRPENEDEIMRDADEDGNVMQVLFRYRRSRKYKIELAYGRMSTKKAVKSVKLMTVRNSLYAETETR